MDQFFFDVRFFFSNVHTDSLVLPVFSGAFIFYFEKAAYKNDLRLLRSLQEQYHAT